MIRDEPFGFETGIALAAASIATFLALERFAVRCHLDSTTARIVSRAAILVICAYAGRGAYRERFAISWPKPRFLVAAVLFGWGSPQVLTWLNTFVVRAFGPDKYDGVVAGEGVVMALVVHALIGPITEELVFRGLLTRSLATRWRWPATIIVSSLVFMLYHSNPYQIVETFCFGAVAAGIILQSRSIIPGIVMHVTTNVWVTLGRYHVPTAFWDRIGDHHDEYAVAAAIATFTALWLLWKGRGE